MVDKLRRFNKVIDLISNTIGRIASYFLVFLMLLVVYEVVMRYVFNRPTLWSMEVNQFLLCFLTALGGLIPSLAVGM